MRGERPLPRVQDGVLISGRRRIPLREVDEVFAVSSRSSLALTMIAVGAAAALGLPLVRMLAVRGGLPASALAGVAAALFVWAVRRVGSRERYCVMIRSGGREDLLLKTADARLVSSIVAELRRQGAELSPSRDLEN